MSDEVLELKAAVDNAYKAFSRYRLGGRITVCSCCVSSETAKALATTPPGAIDFALLCEYTGSAHEYSQGSTPTELRALLPRYFEFLAGNQYPTNGLETHTLSRLGQANYRADWPGAEVRAVDCFFDALFAAALVSPFECRERRGLIDCEGVDIKRVLMLIANAGREIAPCLVHWDATPGRIPDLRIAALAYGVNVLKPAVHPAWDGLTIAADRELMGWLARPQTRERLETACLNETDPTAEWLFSLAEDVIVALMSRPQPL